MVCSRCKMVVKAEIEKLGLHPVTVELGEVEIEEDSIDKVKKELLNNFQALGFDLIDDKKSQLIEHIKTIIIDLVHYKGISPKYNLSEILIAKLNYDYSYLSNLFSEIEGTTIEKYFISQKIEKAKELIVYDELNLSEIAFRLHYSSVSHLSNQFKKVTGLSPSHFKKIKDEKRKPLDKV